MNQQTQQTAGLVNLPASTFSPLKCTHMILRSLRYSPPAEGPGTCKELQGFYFWFWSWSLKPQALPGRHQWVWEELPHRNAPLGSGRAAPGGIKRWVRGFWGGGGGGGGVRLVHWIWFLWFTDTYKVRRLFAEQPHGGHPLNCCVDVRQRLQQRGLARRSLCGGWRTLQGDGSVGHPATIVILIEKRESGVKLVYSICAVSSKFASKTKTRQWCTCPVLTAECWPEQVKITIVTNLINSSKVMNFWGIPVNENIRKIKCRQSIHPFFPVFLPHSGSSSGGSPAQ